MMMKENWNTHLVCNARSPLISNGRLREELILHAIDAEEIEPLIQDFSHFTGREINADTDISTLSGGQKVMLMLLLALHSPANSIIFVDLWHSLDEQNQAKIKKLLDEYTGSKEIILKESGSEV
jgi:ABC-type Mn2+/Zn2+ transport system ATPase subunit